jgi:hypothetical protein
MSGAPLPLSVEVARVLPFRKRKLDAKKPARKHPSRLGPQCQMLQRLCHIKGIIDIKPPKVPSGVKIGITYRATLAVGLLLHPTPQCGHVDPSQFATVTLDDLQLAKCAIM